MKNIPVCDDRACLEALMAASRPGVNKILAFYDSRINMICKDGRLLLVPLDDHICHRGDGLFESICYRQRKIFALAPHLNRLAEGAAMLGINPPCPFEAMEEIILAVARAADQDHGDLRVFLSRGPGGFGVSPEECPRPSFYVVALAAPLPQPEVYAKGLTAFSSEIPPKQAFLARIKNTNYLPNVFMAAEAVRKGMDVAITFDSNGHMGEAAIANVAIVDKDGCLRSPEAGSILAGTTLQAALRLARQKMPVKEGPIHQKEISEAREMLLLTSATLCVAITHFNGAPVGKGAEAGRPGQVAMWLKNALLAEMLATGVEF